jgi:DNA-directed RNA polymerase subunit RPC12/RpoP
MAIADAGPIVQIAIFGDSRLMSDSGRKRKATGPKKPAAHTCAICKREFQPPLQTASKTTIYSICPDCRMEG